MSENGYLIWFIATAVMTFVVMGTCVAGAAGTFSKASRARRHLLKDEARRLSVPRQRSDSSAAADLAGERAEPRSDERADGHRSDASR